MHSLVALGGGGRRGGGGGGGGDYSYRPSNCSPIGYRTATVHQSGGRYRGMKRSNKKTDAYLTLQSLLGRREEEGELREEATSNEG